MRKKAKLRMSNRAESDLDRLQRKSAAQGAPKTARSYVSRLRKYASRLRDFPESGAVVEEFDDPSIREIDFRGQRRLYRYDGVWVVIITVFHGSNVPNPTDLLGD
jgi:plasmid stabilization system protein ParE